MSSIVQPTRKAVQASKPNDGVNTKSSETSKYHDDKNAIPSTSRDSKISHQGSRADVFVIGDSIIKHVQGRRLSKKFKVNNMSFPGASVADIDDYIKPIMRKKPKKVIIHAGTNDLKRHKPKQISKKIIDLANNAKKLHPSTDIAISSIITRADDTTLNLKIHQVNECLKNKCTSSSFEFICNDNVKSDSFNMSGLHLNHKGTITLAANFRKFININ